MGFLQITPTWTTTSSSIILPLSLNMIVPPSLPCTATCPKSSLSLTPPTKQALLALPSTKAWLKNMHQKHNKDSPDDLFDTVEDLQEQLFELHINEIIPVKQLNTNSPWDQVVLWHHFNSQWLYAKVNWKKGSKVDKSLYQKIVGDVKTFWKDEENRASALKVHPHNYL